LGGGEKGVAFAVLLAGGEDWKTRWTAEFLTPSQSGCSVAQRSASRKATRQLVLAAALFCLSAPPIFLFIPAGILFWVFWGWIDGSIWLGGTRRRLTCGFLLCYSLVKSLRVV
jgi:hypothetical protein